MCLKMHQQNYKKFEDNFLAPYASKSYNSRGRVHKEKEHPYRSAYQRDRDRIIHSAAFRRLEYKTQVFVNDEGDYYRTRLTHTLEVAQIARTIAGALGLNPDLTEALALAHDLGHAPFGHAGEEVLNELMKDCGGFNHNLHGLRVVDLLEERYPNFSGLNLTWEVREGIVKHSSAFDTSVKLKELAPDELPTLESQVVDIADEIAYDNHDLDDGLTSKLLDDSELKDMEIWIEISKEISCKHSRITPEMEKYLVIRSLINRQVTDVIEETQKKIVEFQIGSAQEAKKTGSKIACFSKKMQELRKPLRELLMEKLYKHYRVIRMSNKARRLIEELFNFYVEKPGALPDRIQKKINRKKIDNKELKPVVCDYIAGFTDRSAKDEYEKLFNPNKKV